jgi:hypothetical protein
MKFLMSNMLMKHHNFMKFNFLFGIKIALINKKESVTKEMIYAL